MTETEKDQNDMLKELAALDQEQNALYEKMRQGKFEEIAKSLEPKPEEPTEMQKADKAGRRYEGEDEDDDESDDDAPAQKKKSTKKKGSIKDTEEPPEDEAKREPVEGWKYKMGDKTGYDTSAADKPKPPRAASGAAKTIEDAKQIERHEKAKWARTEKEPGKPLVGPPHERTGATPQQFRSIENQAFEENLRSGRYAPKKGEDYDEPRGDEKNRAGAYYRMHLGEDMPSKDEDKKTDLMYMWDNTLPGVRGKEAYLELRDTPKGEKNKRLKAQGTQRHFLEGKIAGRRNITANQFFGEDLHRTPDSAAYWKKILGKAIARAMMKSLDVMTEYMYASVGETLNKSLYSDYESDLVELIKSEFEQERDIAIEEIVKMVMQDDEFEADFDEIEKAIKDAEEADAEEEDEIVKAFNVMADAIVAIADDLELMKSAMVGDDYAFEEIAKAVRRKGGRHLIQRRVPLDSTKKEPDEDYLEDEGDDEDDEMKKCSSANGGAGSDSKDSTASVRKGDITTPDLRSHTEESVIPKNSPQPVNKADAFEAGKKIGAIEAIQKSVNDQGIATLPPGETVNQERLDPIAKMLNDNSALLNASFRALEKSFRNPEN